MNNLPDTMLAKLRVEECKIYGLEGMCWIWTGCLNSKGYGCVQIANKRHLTHRASYELHTGEIPAGLQIDHLCRRRACFNPHHLEAVTAKENVRRAVEDRQADLDQQEEDRADELLGAWLERLAS